MSTNLWRRWLFPHFADQGIDSVGMFPGPPQPARKSFLLLSRQIASVGFPLNLDDVSSQLGGLFGANLKIGSAQTWRYNSSRSMVSFSDSIS